MLEVDNEEQRIQLLEEEAKRNNSWQHLNLRMNSPFNHKLVNDLITSEKKVAELNTEVKKLFPQETDNVIREANPGLKRRPSKSKNSTERTRIDDFFKQNSADKKMKFEEKKRKKLLQIRMQKMKRQVSQGDVPTNLNIEETKKIVISQNHRSSFGLSPEQHRQLRLTIQLSPLKRGNKQSNLTTKQLLNEPNGLSELINRFNTKTELVNSDNDDSMNLSKEKNKHTKKLSKDLEGLLPPIPKTVVISAKDEKKLMRLNTMFDTSKIELFNKREKKKRDTKKSSDKQDPKFSINPANKLQTSASIPDNLNLDDPSVKRGVGFFLTGDNSGSVNPQDLFKIDRIEEDPIPNNKKRSLLRQESKVACRRIKIVHSDEESGEYGSGSGSNRQKKDSSNEQEKTVTRKLNKEFDELMKSSKSNIPIVEIVEKESKKESKKTSNKESTKSIEHIDTNEKTKMNKKKSRVSQANIDDTIGYNINYKIENDQKEDVKHDTIQDTYENKDKVDIDAATMFKRSSRKNSKKFSDKVEVEKISEIGGSKKIIDVLKSKQDRKDSSASDSDFTKVSKLNKMKSSTNPLGHQRSILKKKSTMRKISDDKQDKQNNLTTNTNLNKGNKDIYNTDIRQASKIDFLPNLNGETDLNENTAKMVEPQTTQNVRNFSYYSEFRNTMITKDHNLFNMSNRNKFYFQKYSTKLSQLFDNSTMASNAMHATVKIPHFREKNPSPKNEIEFIREDYLDNCSYQCGISDERNIKIEEKMKLVKSKAIEKKRSMDRQQIVADMEVYNTKMMGKKLDKKKNEIVSIDWSSVLKKKEKESSIITRLSDNYVLRERESLMNKFNYNYNDHDDYIFEPILPKKEKITEDMIADERAKKVKGLIEGVNFKNKQLLDKMKHLK